MFSLKLIEGEWFRNSDASLEIPPALITQRLADRIELTGNAIGQTIHYNGRTYRITGVVEAFKDRPNEEQQSALFIPLTTYSDMGWSFEYTVKYKPDMKAEFANAFFEEFFRIFPRDQWMPMIVDLSDMMGLMGFFSLLTVYLFGIPTGFLLIFAFMGTFGVVWMQSKKRMSELGLRIALGCTPARLQRLHRLHLSRLTCGIPRAERRKQQHQNHCRAYCRTPFPTFWCKGIEISHYNQSGKHSKGSKYKVFYDDGTHKAGGCAA
jgi:hypothetical protein